MEIITICTYILLFILTSRHRNLLLPVRADGEDSTRSCAASNGTKVAGLVNNDPVESSLSLKSLVNEDKKEADGVLLFKENQTVKPREMDTNDFLSDSYMGNLTYAFKPNVECILVRFDDKDVWKKGDGTVQLPKSVTYDSVLLEFTVRDSENSAYFKKDPETGEWKHFKTTPRKKGARRAQNSQSSS
ncbi:hypothetical protein MACK_003320 [Theileria orientalis]|uniref:Uncharacterized protein n=1 Tax=Theileria orientalis TaxID=68886 RepID=A0A976XJ44_THEOR|nr:hypothetical protein MACK_003320 [Theileria orientalis]